MPAIAPGSKVLVSGANGYIAMWVVRTLLEKGYSVRGTARSAEKGKYLQEYFKSYGDKFEFVVVTDITADGAFDEAVKGMDAIEHTASPFHSRVDHPEEFINPAVRGTVGMLESALKNGPNVKRIVVTSSCASVLRPVTHPTTFTEKDWNEVSTKEVEEKGRDAAPMSKYRASKTLAEKAAWNFYNKHKDQIKWDLAVINPPFVFGPAIQEIASPEALNTSLKHFYDAVLVNTPKSKEELAFSNAWVDVRDVALAHVLSLEKEAAGGERIITSSGPYTWQDWLNAANSLSPSPIPGHKLPVGDPSIQPVYLMNYNTEKSDRILGIKYKTKMETTKDTLADFASRGW